MATKTLHLVCGAAAALAAAALLALPSTADARWHVGAGCSLHLPGRSPDRHLVVPILMYHRINVVTSSTPMESRGLTVHPDDFARQMTWLNRHGYRTITQRELFDALICGRSLGRRPIMITFDDGYRDTFFKASPVLLRLGMRATAYVVSGRISGPDPSFLTWPLLHALEQRGIEIGSHTVAHRNLPALSDRALFADLAGSRRTLERRLGHRVPWLAYPFGAYDARVERMARRAGYFLAVTTEGGAVQSARRPLALRRLRVLDTTGVRGLAAMLGASGHGLAVARSASETSGPVEQRQVVSGLEPSGRPAAALGAGFEAHFTQRSYGPGDHARLVVSGMPRASVQFFRVGPERRPATRDDAMNGVPVNDSRRVHGGAVTISIRHWPPGLYFARVSGGGRTRFAPFVLRASPLFRPRVAVVLPTNTWQAYNLRDDDGDGVPNSWYASEAVTTVSLARPFLRRGVPPYFRQYDLQFLRWLVRSRKDTDFLADDDLETVPTPTALAARYDLLVFAGHEEYVTPHTFDLVEGYRDRGGNLAFLSANNFFYRVLRSGSSITRAERWRDLGRSEASLVGVQYVDWFQNVYPNRPYVVTGARRASWLFRGTGLEDGDRFGLYGIEIDARAPASPPGTHVLATIPDAFGPGKSAEMTYYTTPRGAKVFAAGVLNFGGAALVPPTPHLLENLWAHLSAP